MPVYFSGWSAKLELFCKYSSEVTEICEAKVTHTLPCQVLDPTPVRGTVFDSSIPPTPVPSSLPQDDDKETHQMILSSSWEDHMLPDC